MTPMTPRLQIHTNGAWDYAYRTSSGFSFKKINENRLNAVPFRTDP